jgi:hypothetical protein
VGAIAVSAVALWTGAPRPYTDPSIDAVTAVAPAIAATRGTVVVDLPADRDATAVAVIRSLNLLRTSVPGDRVTDLVLRYPAPTDGDTDAMSLWTASEDAATRSIASGSATEISAPAAPPPAPANPVADTAVAMLVWLAACGLAGAGWCRAGGHYGVALLERATGTGLAGLIVAGAIADRVGLRLGSRPVAIGVVAAVTGAGAVVAIASRRARAHRGPGSPGATTSPDDAREAPFLHRAGAAMMRA